MAEALACAGSTSRCLSLCGTHNAALPHTLLRRPVPLHTPPYPSTPLASECCGALNACGGGRCAASSAQSGKPFTGLKDTDGVGVLADVPNAAHAGAWAHRGMVGAGVGVLAG